MPKDKMPVDKIYLDKMLVDLMSLNKMLVDLMSLDKMLVDLMSLDVMSVYKKACLPFSITSQSVLSPLLFGENKAS